MNWRELLRGNRLLYELNARLKAARAGRRYRKLAAEFARSDEGQRPHGACDVGDMVRRRLESRGARAMPKAMGKLRILYVGTDWNQDSSGILQALARFGEVIAFEARPGRYGALWPAGDLLSVREENSRRLVEEAVKAAADGPVDIVLGQMWGFTMDVAALKRVAATGPVVVNISMDDRHVYRWKRIGGRWTGTSGLIPALDLAATAAPECCSWYIAEGCPAVFFPEASDPDLFFPEPAAKEHDACFVGANYGIRREIVTALERAGIRVAAFGKGWPAGPIPTEKVPSLFARSRIVLGVGTIGHTRDLFSLKMRDFDGPMSGSMYLTHHNPDLEPLFEIGKELETYRTVEDCVAKVRYYLERPEAAEAIGRAGRARALRDHTWEKRFAMLFRAAGVLSAGDPA